MLGRDGPEISRLVFGTSGLAAMGEAEARRLIESAIERGVTTIELDVADQQAVAFVGNGISRGRLKGQVEILARLRPSVPFELPSPHITADDAFPAASIEDQIDTLRHALEVDRIDLIQLHAWCPEWLHEGAWLDTLRHLKSDGRIGGIGISLWDHDVDAGLEAAESRAVDAIQLMLNIFDPSAMERLLPICAQQNIGVIARAALHFGALGWQDGASDLPPLDWRSDYFEETHKREVLRRIGLLRDALGQSGNLAETGLRFALSHPAVTAVAVGMHSADHLAADIAAVARGPLEPALVQSLMRHRWLC